RVLHNWKVTQCLDFVEILVSAKKISLTYIVIDIFRITSNGVVFPFRDYIFEDVIYLVDSCKFPVTSCSCDAPLAGHPPCSSSRGGLIIRMVVISKGPDAAAARRSEALPR